MTAQASGMHIVSRRALLGSSILVVESALRLASSKPLVATSLSH